MAHKIKGALDVSGKLTVNSKQVATSVNNILPDSAGKITMDFSDYDITGTEGDSLRYASASNTVPDKLVKFARVIDSDIELAKEKEKIDTFSTVFNTWDRFSHGFAGNFPDTSAELQAWQYVSNTDSILCTLNTVTYVGFVSPEKYTNYELEVNVNAATDATNDDDFIGLVLAYQEIDGVQYTLSALRRPNIQVGFVNGNLDVGDWCWVIAYNFGQDTTYGEYKVANGNSQLTTVPTTDSKPWNTIPNGVNIKAVRTGDTITVSTTDINNLNTYIAPLTVDLNSDPRLAKFKNPSSIGYSAQSQSNSSFKNIKFSGTQNVIYDNRNGNVWYYQNSAWGIDSTANIFTNLGNGIIASNPNTNKCFYVNTPDIKLMAGFSVGFGTGQVPDMSGFTYVNSSSGYQKLPSGLIMQWFTINQDGTNGMVSMAPPIPFPNGIYQGWVSSNTFSAGTATVYAFDKNNSTKNLIYVRSRVLTTSTVSYTGTFNCKVFVIGY